MSQPDRTPLHRTADFVDVATIPPIDPAAGHPSDGSAPQYHYAWSPDHLVAVTPPAPVTPSVHVILPPRDTERPVLSPFLSPTPHHHKVEIVQAIEAMGEVLDELIACEKDIQDKLYRLEYLEWVTQQEKWALDDLTSKRKAIKRKREEKKTDVDVERAKRLRRDNGAIVSVMQDRADRLTAARQEHVDGKCDSVDVDSNKKCDRNAISGSNYCSKHAYGDMASGFSLQQPIAQPAPRPQLVARPAPRLLQSAPQAIPQQQAHANPRRRAIPSRSVTQHHPSPPADTVEHHNPSPPTDVDAMEITLG